jgi:uncharacterized membrane protein
MTLRITLVAASLALLITGCNPHRGEGNGGVPGDQDSHKPFAAIAATDTVHFAGTEPFWSGQARGTTLTYATPATPEGTEFAVRRFGGRNGLGLSGTFQDKTFDMTVTPGTCSDGMSDRRYPFTVTLKIGEEVRQGCGWTNRKGFTQPQS